jgi:hypothetical protein
MGRKRFIDKLKKPNRQIEQDAADIEWDETEGSVGGGVIAAFRRDLRRGLQDAASETIADEDLRSERDERTEDELLNYELNKALAKSPKYHKQYLKRELERRRRIDR